MKIKLAYVINNFNLGGAEKLLLSTVKYLSQNFDVFVFSMLGGDHLFDDFMKTGATIIRLNMRNKRDIRGFFKLWWYFKKYKFRIVHTHLLEADIYGRFAAIFAGVPVILTTEHTLEPWKIQPKTYKTRIRLFLNKIAVNFSSGVIAVSNKVKDYLMKYESVPDEKIFVIHNGIEIKQTLKVSSRKSESNPTIFGSVGRFVEAKRYDYLLNAFAQVKKRHPNCKLILAGDGPLRKQLENQACEQNISEDVTFTGFTDNISDFFNDIDIFVISSVQEGIPLVLLEAMAAQKPIIATEVGGIPEVIVHESEGLLVEPANVEALAE